MGNGSKLTIDNNCEIDIEKTIPLEFDKRTFILALPNKKTEKAYTKMLNTFFKTKTGKKILNLLSPEQTITIIPRDLTQEHCGGYNNSFHEVHLGTQTSMSFQFFALCHELVHEVSRQKGFRKFLSESTNLPKEAFFAHNKNDELAARLTEVDLMAELQTFPGMLKFAPQNHLFAWNTLSDFASIQFYKSKGMSEQDAKTQWAKDVLIPPTNLSEKRNKMFPSVTDFLNQLPSCLQPIAKKGLRMARDGLFVASNIANISTLFPANTYKEDILQRNKYWNEFYNNDYKGSIENYEFRRAFGKKTPIIPNGIH